MFDLYTVQSTRLLIWWLDAIAETEWMIVLNRKEVIVGAMNLVLITKSEVFTGELSSLNLHLIWLISVNSVVWLSHLDVTGLLGL